MKEKSERKAALQELKLQTRRGKNSDSFTFTQARDSFSYSANVKINVYPDLGLDLCSENFEDKGINRKCYTKQKQNGEAGNNILC